MKKIRFDIFVLAIFVFYICEHVIHSLSPPTAFLWGWPQWFTLTVIVWFVWLAFVQVWVYNSCKALGQAAEDEMQPT